MNDVDRRDRRERAQGPRPRDESCDATLAGQAVDGKAVNEMVTPAAGTEMLQTFRLALRLNILKGTHKPLIHPPLGFCRKAGAFFCTLPFRFPSQPSRSNVRIRTDVLAERLMRARLTPPSGRVPEPMSSRLARSAGLIGIATMASRILGVVREIVLAGLFGASADSGDGCLQRRVPRPESPPGSVRRRGDDGSVRADVHSHAQRTRPRSGLATRQSRHQRAAARDGRPRHPGDCVR